MAVICVEVSGHAFATEDFAFERQLKQFQIAGHCDGACAPPQSGRDAQFTATFMVRTDLPEPAWLVPVASIAKVSEPLYPGFALYSNDVTSSILAVPFFGRTVILEFLTTPPPSRLNA